MTKKYKYHTYSYENMMCPKCGLLGQFKVRLNKLSFYQYVDHYGLRGITSHHITYRSSCYLGVV